MYPAWYFWILFALAMAVSSIGFKNYVWFIPSATASPSPPPASSC